MEVTPKLPRKSLSLTSSLRRSRASASPSNRVKHSTIPSSPISISSENGLEGTPPPNRRYIFNAPNSPSTEYDFSPRSQSVLSQSSNNSPDVTWRWTQDEPSNDRMSPSLARSTPNNTGFKEVRRKMSIERKEEIRKAEKEKRKAMKTKREIVLKKQCEEVELIILKTSASEPEQTKKTEQTPSLNKIEPLPSNDSSGFGSYETDLLNDSDLDGLLLQATQQVESIIKASQNMKSPEKNKNKTPKQKEDFEEIEKPSSDFLQDSFDDFFKTVDIELLTSQEKKSNLQRHKSMPTDSPGVDKSKKIKRYPSSNTLPPKSSIECTDKMQRQRSFLKIKLIQNQCLVKEKRIECFKRPFL